MTKGFNSKVLIIGPLKDNSLFYLSHSKYLFFAQVFYFHYGSASGVTDSVALCLLGRPLFMFFCRTGSLILWRDVLLKVCH